MKQLFLILLTLVLTINLSYGQILYESPVVKETNISKSLMWLNLKKWVSTSFNTYKYVVDLEDKESGIMIIKWSSSIPFNYNNYCIKNGYLILTMNSIITIELKENKYRYTVGEGSVTNTLGYLSQNDINNMSTEALKLVQSDLKFVAETGEYYFNNSLVWKFDKRIDELINDYKQRLISTSTTTAKGKSNPDYGYIQNHLEYLKGIKEGYNSVIILLCKSLENSINMSYDNF